MVVAERNRTGTILEAAMPSLTIRNIPAEVHEGLRRLAFAHRRSLNQQILEILAKNAPRPPIDVEGVLAEIRAARKRRNWPPMTQKEIRDAINEGRP